MARLPGTWPECILALMLLAGLRKLRVRERISVFLTRVSCIPPLGVGGHRVITLHWKLFQGPGSGCVMEVTWKTGLCPSSQTLEAVGSPGSQCRRDWLKPSSEHLCYKVSPEVPSRLHLWSLCQPQETLEALMNYHPLAPSRVKPQHWALASFTFLCVGNQLHNWTQVGE